MGGAMRETKPKSTYRMLSVRVSPQLLKKIKRRALDDDTSGQAVVIAAIETYLKNGAA
jgi:hypothetical protein